MTNKTVFIIIGVIVAIDILGYGTYLYFQNASLQNTVASLSASVSSLTDKLSEAMKNNDALTETLATKQDQVNYFSSQVGNIADTVDTLKKISETDPELLKKYSKIYFLNENYVPAKLENIDSKYLYNKNDPLLIHGQVFPKLENMLADASSSGVDLLVISAFRSFGVQATLKSSYKVTYGSGSNKFSADQGYSEHQLGTAVDLTTSKVADTFSGFEKTASYKWLQNNAYKYGFTLSYPPNNKYYVYEPWHWRFVGVALATYLQNSNQYFYDLDQRTIDSYLPNLFD